MTWDLALWLSSAAGATLFFGAGVLLARAARSNRSAAALTILQQETAALQAQLAQLAVERTNLEGEANRSQTERQQLRAALESAQRDAAAFGAAHQRALDAARETARREERLRVQVAAAEHGQELSAERLRKATAAESSLKAELAAKTAEIQQGRARLDTQIRAHRQLQQESAELHTSLVNKEGLRAELQHEIAELRTSLVGKEALQAELQLLRAETAQQRSRTLGARTPEGTRLLSMDGGGLSRGSVFQSLVERVFGLADIRCAVIADDLGLVVASHGELADEVAAVGALFGRAGVQAQRVLPLRTVQRVTVEDDQGVVLTLRPLRTDDLGEAELALITLAVGAGPDQRQVNKLIDERSAAETQVGRRSVGASP